MKRIKVGMIGAGAIANDHCNGVNRHADSEMIAVADPSETRAKDLQKRFPTITKIYSDAKDLIADPELDAVSIGVPNAFHAPYALAALKAGKHVILDKPFALNQKEALAVLQAAKKAKKVFTLGMNQRFNPDSQKIHALAQAGKLGEIYHGKAFWFRRSGIPKFGTWFCQKKFAGGGALLDIGVHLLDLCLYLMDNFHPEAVSGTTYTKFGNRGLGEGGWGMSDRGKHVFDVDDYATALIKLKGGASVTLDVSWAIHQEEPNRNNVQLFGTEAGATAYPARVFRYGKGKGEYEVLNNPDVKIAYPDANRFMNWMDAIVGKDKLCCPPEQALAVQKILDGIYASAKTGKESRIR